MDPKNECYFLVFLGHPLWPNSKVTAQDGQAELPGTTFASGDAISDTQNRKT